MINEVSMEEKINIDSILSFIFLKKLMTPITETDAYKLGIVNNTGRVIKEPKTKEELKSLTILDSTIFKLKRLLGTKTIQLNNFLFLQTLSNDFYNKIVVRGSIEGRAEIKRIQNDIRKVSEKYNISMDDMMNILINEETRKNK